MLTEARSPDPIFVFQGFQASHFRRNVGLILSCSPQTSTQSRLWVCHFSSIHVQWQVIHAAWWRLWRSYHMCHDMGHAADSPLVVRIHTVVPCCTNGDLGPQVPSKATGQSSVVEDALGAKH